MSKCKSMPISTSNKIESPLARKYNIYQLKSIYYVKRQNYKGEDECNCSIKRHANEIESRGQRKLQ